MNWAGDTQHGPLSTCAATIPINNYESFTFWYRMQHLFYGLLSDDALELYMGRGSKHPRVLYLRSRNYMMASVHFHSVVALMMIISIGWDYVSELRPQTGLLFIPQVIHEHAEQWWNESTEENLIRPPGFSANPTSRHLVANQEEVRKDGEFSLRSIFVHTSKWFLHEVLVDFLSKSRQMPGQYLNTRPRPLSSISFPIHHSLTTISFDAI
jgi:hypothetical protein